MSLQDGRVTARELGLHLDNMRFGLDAERGLATVVIDQPEKMNRVTMPMRSNRTSTGHPPIAGLLELTGRWAAPTGEKEACVQFR